jgi:hypothetical protein
MNFFKTKYKRKLIFLIFLIIYVPLVSFFCYNLGMYSGFTDTVKGTFDDFLPMLPVTLLAAFLVYKYLVKRNK